MMDLRIMAADDGGWTAVSPDEDADVELVNNAGEDAWLVDAGEGLVDVRRTFAATASASSSDAARSPYRKL